MNLVGLFIDLLFSQIFKQCLKNIKIEALMYKKRKEWYSKKENKTPILLLYCETFIQMISLSLCPFSYIF